MELVEAIKTESQRSAVTELLARYGGSDLYADIWKFGLNAALRISDLLEIKYSDIDSGSISLIETKTGKSREIRLNDNALAIVSKRKAAHPDDVYLFQVHSNRASGKPVNRSTVARMFKEVGQTLGLKLGTHSMRKTRGYVMFKAGVSIEKISKLLNHSSTGTTLAYIGIEKEDIQQTYDDFNL